MRIYEWLRIPPLSLPLRKGEINTTIPSLPRRGWGGLIILFVICNLLLVIPTANAVGISVSPPQLELKGVPNQKLTGTFTVTNPSRETVIYEITNDGLLALAITPTTFLLEPNKSAKVTVEYQPQCTGRTCATPTRTQTNLSILGRPLTVNPTQAASGIKLPVTISTGQAADASTRRFDPLTLGIMIIDSLLLLWLAYLIIKRFRLRPTHPYAPPWEGTTHPVRSASTPPRRGFPS